MKFCIPAILTLLLALHAPKAAAQSTGEIGGRVVNPAGEPVAAAGVAIENEYIGGYTDGGGYYRLTKVPAGELTLVFSYQGGQTASVNVTLAKGQKLTVPDVTIDDMVQISSVTVVGKSEARKVQEQAYAVSVVDLKRSYNSSIDLAGLMNRTSGVRIREEGGVGSGYSFTLNGFSGRQVKMFMDGLAMDNFGASFGLNNLPANMVERVEVYKGVLPIGLGADALGGAVNIVTRKTEDFIDVSYSYGSFNTHKASVNGAFTTRKGFTVRLNTFGNYSDNNYKVNVPIIDLTTGEKRPNQWVRRFHDNYKSAGARFETGMVDRRWADYFLVGMIAAANEKEIQHGAVMDLVYGGRVNKNLSLVPSLRYKKENLFTDGLNLSIYGAYSHTSERHIDTLSRRFNWLGQSVPDNPGERSLTQAHIKSREWRTNSSVDYTVGLHHTVSANYVFSDARREISDVEDPANEDNQIPQTIRKHIVGLGWMTRYDRWSATAFGKFYAMDAQTYQKTLSTDPPVQVGQSYKYWGYGGAVTWFALKRLQFKVSYEKTYRLPDATEMFGDNQEYSRNANLRPEHSHNVNAGFMFEHFFRGGHTVNLEAGYLYRDSRDFIHKELKQPSLISVNIGKVETQGVEVNLGYSWRNIVRVGGNFTWQRIVDNRKTTTSQTIGGGENENFNYRAEMPNTPWLFANLNAGFSWPDLFFRNTSFTVDYYLGYVHEYYLSWPGLGQRDSKDIIPQQLYHNAAIGYSIAGGMYNVSVECNNFTNAELYDNYRLQKPGRSWTLRLRFYFGKSATQQ